MKSKLLLVVVFPIVASPTIFAQGPLTPSGAPAATMKSLDQIEPRTPVSSVPYTISQSGSYYLSRNLQFTAASGHAITITASDVTLDLMGFTLSSSSAVTGDAIRLSAGLRNIEIRNGVINGNTTVAISGTAPNKIWTASAAGFGSGINALSATAGSCHFSHLRISGCRTFGLNGGERAVVEKVTAAQNGGVGIEIAGDGSITNCTASSNGGIGISADSGSITNCVAVDNGGHGISGSLTAIANSHLSGNGDNGISSFRGSVTNCIASANGSVGISGYSVTNSVAYFNGGNGIGGAGITNCTAYSNDGSGISGGLVTNCMAQDNGSHGISAASGVVSFCKAFSNNTNNNGSVDISASGATRTGNHPAP